MDQIDVNKIDNSSITSIDDLNQQSSIILQNVIREQIIELINQKNKLDAEIAPLRENKYKSDLEQSSFNNLLEEENEIKESLNKLENIIGKKKYSEIINDPNLPIENITSSNIKLLNNQSSEYFSKGFVIISSIVLIINLGVLAYNWYLYSTDIKSLSWIPYSFPFLIISSILALLSLVFLILSLFPLNPLINSWLNWIQVITIILLLISLSINLYILIYSLVNKPST